MNTFHLYTTTDPLSPNSLPMPLDEEMEQRLQKAKGAEDLKGFSCLMMTRWAPRDDLDEIVKGTFHGPGTPVYSYAGFDESTLASRKLEAISVKGSCRFGDLSYVLFQRVDFAVINGGIRFKNDERIFIVELSRFKKMELESFQYKLHGLAIPYIAALSWVPLPPSCDTSLEGKGHLVPDAGYFRAYNKAHGIVCELLDSFREHRSLFSCPEDETEQGFLDSILSSVGHLNSDGATRESFLRDIELSEEKTGE